MCVRGVAVLKIQGSVQYDTMVSRFGTFSIQGGGINAGSRGAAAPPGV